jgi:hypothetical protein
MQTATDMGSIKNQLNWFSSDLKKLRPQEVIKTTKIPVRVFSKVTKTSRPQAYKYEITLKPEIHKRFIHLAQAAEIVFEIFKGDLKETSRWIMSPNEYFMGDSPFEVCLRGDGPLIIKWLAQHKGNNPG